MKKILLCVVPLVTLTSCVLLIGNSADWEGEDGWTWGSWNDALHGSGVEASEAREVPAFRRVELLDAVDLELVIGEGPALTLTGDDNLLEHVETQVDGGTLRIGMKDGSYEFERPMVAQVTATTLERLGISGSSDAHLDKLSGGRLELSISGSGDVRAHGQVDELSVKISGSGDVELFDLVARDVRVSISGSGDADVHATESLNVSISGSGDVRYRGNPRSQANISGSGSLANE